MEQKKKIRKTSSISKTTALLEVALIVVLYYIIWRNMYPEGTFPYYLGRGKYVLMGVYAVLSIVIMYLCEGFRFGYLRNTDLLFSQCIGIFISNFITYFQLSLIANVMINVRPILILTLGDFMVAALCVSVFGIYYQKNNTAHEMLMIYGNRDSVTLKLKMDTRDDRYNVTNLISVEEGLEKIQSEIDKYDAVVISDVSAEMRNDIVKYCYLNSVRTYVTPKISDVVMRGAEGIHLFDTPLLLIKTGGITPEQAAIKRFFDVLLSSLAAIVLSPFMLIVAIAIKLEDHGPVLYKQRRVTIDGKEFDILKFRSMIVDAEKDGVKPATDHDDRITKVGHFIRAIRFDEIPQLFNIIKGDMSIVGPRPERVEHVAKYTEEIPEFVFRSKVKGGLTGYAQVYGKYNTTAYDKLKLDLMYIENYSLLLDIKLVLMTLRILFKKESTEGFDKVLSADEILGDEPETSTNKNEVDEAVKHE